MTKKKARIAYRLARSQRGSGIDADLAPAQVAGIVDPADGTLNKDVLAGEFLKVTLPQWAGLVTDPGDSDTFSSIGLSVQRRITTRLKKCLAIPLPHRLILKPFNGDRYSAE